MALGKKTGGRQKGTRNRASTARAARAALAGVLPADVMLDNMRHYMARAAATERLRPTKTRTKAEIIAQVDQCRSMAQTAARDAAPYYHNKLSSVEIGGLNGRAIETKTTGTVTHVLDDASLKKIADLVK